MSKHTKVRHFIPNKFGPTWLLYVPLTLLADYQDGLDAYSYGDYARAMQEWRAVTDGPPTAVNPAIYVEAHYAVAMLYWQGQGVEQDYARAREWLQTAAKMNHAGAQAKLGFMYTDGVAVVQDYGTALKWFEKAARAGNVDGLYNLGVFYLYGWGVEKDPTRAAQYLARASALGDAEAEDALRQVLRQIEEKARSEPVRLDELPEPKAEDELPFLDEAWIRAQNPEHYTIQVTALRSRERLLEFMRQHEQFAPYAIYTVQKGETPLHVLLQGSYADVESARAAKERFPRRIQRQDALWIRRFEMVQRLLE